MIRFIFRSLALILLACAFAAAIVDGTRSIAADTIMFSTFGQALAAFLPTKLAELQAAASKIHPLLRDPGLRLFLLVPLWLLFGGIGSILLALTQPRRPIIGFSSR